jgi:very-short-patch-repair endonuclease
VAKDALIARGRPTVVEYDGIYWHLIYKDRSQQDVAKTEALLAAGYDVIRIRENGLPFIPVTHPNLRQVTFELISESPEDLVTLLLS